MTEFEDIVRENLRKIVRAYAKGHQTTIVNVSRKFYGQHGFLDAFFAGKQSTSLRKLEEMLTAITATWPEDTDWPLCRVIVFNPPPPRAAEAVSTPNPRSPPRTGSVVAAARRRNTVVAA